MANHAMTRDDIRVLRSTTELKGLTKKLRWTMITRYEILLVTCVTAQEKKTETSIHTGRRLRILFAMEHY